MEIVYYILIGIIQGFTEFLPISSSGHVILFEEIFDISKPGFSEAINLGSLLAVLIYFRAEILTMTINQFNFLIPKTKSSKSVLKSEKSDIFDNKNLLLKIILVSIPIGVLGKSVDYFWDYEQDKISLLIIGISSIFFGLILLYFYNKSKKNIENVALTNTSASNTRKVGLLKKPLSFKSKGNLEKVSYKKMDGNVISNIKKTTNRDLLVISLCQALAIIPGASRSGMSMLGAYARGLTKEQVSILIFLLSIPPTGMATLNELVLKSNFNIDLEFILASIACFITAMISIKFLLTLIQNLKLEYLIYYRILFGILTILFWVLNF